MKAILTGLVCAALLLGAAESRERRLRLAFDDVTAWATALLNIVAGIEQQLAEKGQKLHPDIRSARDEVETAMDEAQEALDNRDWDSLSRRIDRARACITKLRRKL